MHKFFDAVSEKTFPLVRKILDDLLEKEENGVGMMNA
jgi:hypothetical protein